MQDGRVTRAGRARDLSSGQPEELQYLSLRWRWETLRLLGRRDARWQMRRPLSQAGPHAASEDSGSERSYRIVCRLSVGTVLRKRALLVEDRRVVT